MGEAWRIGGGAGQPDARTTPSCQNTVGMGGKGQGSAAPSSHVWTSPAPPALGPKGASCHEHAAYHCPCWYWAVTGPQGRPRNALRTSLLGPAWGAGLELQWCGLLPPAAPAAVSLDPSSADCWEGGGASLGLPCNSLHPHPGRVLAPAPRLDPVRRRSSHAVMCRLLNGCLVPPARCPSSQLGFLGPASLAQRYQPHTQLQKLEGTGRPLRRQAKRKIQV